MKVSPKMGPKKFPSCHVIAPMHTTRYLVSEIFTVYFFSSCTHTDDIKVHFSSPMLFSHTKVNKYICIHISTQIMFLMCVLETYCVEERFRFYLQSYSAKINKYIHVFWFNYFLNVSPRNLLVSLCFFTWFKKTMSTFIIKIKGALGRRSFSLQPWL